MKEDKMLYEEFLNGNDDAFNIIINKYTEKLIYFIYTYVKNMEVAKDLSQDVFVYLWLHKDCYNSKYSLKTYLYIIAKSRALNYLKREKRIIFIEREQLLEQENELIDVEEIVFKNLQKNDVINAMKKLNSEQAKVLYLANIEGFKYEEISKILGKKLGQVKSLIHRARKNMKKILDEEVMKNV